MTDWIAIKKDEKHIAREKAKARELRKSNWWKQKIAAGICYYCGKKFKPQELTMDHIVPIARGGKSIKRNVVPACKECNLSCHIDGAGASLGVFYSHSVLPQGQ